MPILLPLALMATAQLPVAAVDRDLAFPGFNGLPLHASVMPAVAHPYFAVLVADAGPTDRNGSNPLFPGSSHAGQDLARWLQAKGLGSLRYDKRFIGSKDPKLDISLDAQVGDVKAALQAARGLPEARGKKLLLVGHGEGALLSLLAAGNADAVLLLAMPPVSMGRLIQTQLKDQLEAAGAPAAVTAANLGYLDACLAALRGDKPLPEASDGVAPGVVRLAQGLARPESRAFVRDLLDLDPWGAVQRLAVPCALVWGDRDIQAWKPAVLPEGFKGTALLIPEANHLFKRETRARATLNGPSAMTAYGDATPMADLGLLAEWLGGLK